MLFIGAALVLRRWWWWPTGSGSGYCRQLFPPYKRLQLHAPVEVRLCGSDPCLCARRGSGKMAVLARPRAVLPSLLLLATFCRRYIRHPLRSHLTDRCVARGGLGAVAETGATCATHQLTSKSMPGTMSPQLLSPPLPSRAQLQLHRIRHRLRHRHRHRLRHRHRHLQLHLWPASFVFVRSVAFSA